MTDVNTDDQLHEITEKLFGRSLRGKTLLGSFGPPFDTSRANIHNSKSEFQAELDAVVAIRDHCRGILDVFLPGKEKETPAHEEMVLRLRVAFQVSVAKDVGKTSIEHPSDVVLKNAVDCGFHLNSMLILLKLLGAANERYKELKDQERDYWIVTHRPPNYHARTIALRFARLYAREKGERPTFGTSSQGGYPSTDFGRALEEVFSILQIKASVRNAAVWALDQLTEEDWKPPQRNALSGLIGHSGPPHSKVGGTQNALSEYARRGQKGSD